MENQWNRLIKLRDNSKQDEIKQKADQLLKQLNTAGGRIIISEINFFLQKFEK